MRVKNIILVILSFLGNTVYSDDQLSKLLGLFKGTLIMVFYSRKELLIHQNQMGKT